jgi:D-alanyl-lipoteichoic acid acyltransferase DltB (MBOAT superfamily)
MQTSLLSPGFLGLALVAIVALRALRGSARRLAFLALNLTFLWGMLLGPVGASSTLVFAVLGYLLVQLAMRKGLTGLTLGIALYVAVFVYLRRYDFVVWIVPDSLLTRVISTVGLSFLFFKVVHVMIDAYSGTIGRLTLVSYLNYALNFTTFTMGPIQRYQDYRDQWDGLKEAIPEDFNSHLDAALRILLGLTKAYVLAPLFQDRALPPDAVLLDLSLRGLVIQSYAFWAYLYLNFSGYCDVVIGIGSLFGVRPPENFNKPFLARNISDFWQRQHRSLTLWLTDYVFSPTYKRLLGRNGGSRFAAANLSLMVTMMISGLWHGTTLSFFLFGLVHGLWFVLYRSWDELLVRSFGKGAVKRLRQNVFAHVGGIFLTFNATALAFVFFQVRPERFVEFFSALFG